MSNRDNIINKVRAILSKTVDNGCSEAEAMAALQMAETMMQNHEITEDDLKLDDEKAVIDSMFCARDPHAISWKLAYFVSKFTETYSYGNRMRIKFAGLRSDIDFAIWLTQTLTRFVQGELKTYMWKNGYQKLEASAKRKVINGFVIGCTSRINVRLKAMIDSRHPTSNGTALVVAKQALIDEAIKDLKIKPTDNRGRKTQMYSHSLHAGREAGDKASFGRPIEQGGLLRLK